MLERFTERARKVFVLANQEAAALGSESIGTEHVLLGLVRPETSVSVAANALRTFNINYPQIKEKVVEMFGIDNPKPDRLLQTPKAKQIIENAEIQAKALNHNYIGTEHILLGMIEDDNSCAMVILESLGVNKQNCRESVLKIVGKEDPLKQAINHLEQAVAILKAMVNK